MPDFAYTARDATGQKVSGVVSAANQREVLAQLAGRSLFPLSVDTRAAEEAQQILASLNLTEAALRQTKELAYGQQRLVEIALALATRPRVLLLDEPAAGVPKNESAELFEVIARLSADLTILFIEHDMEVVFRFASRILVMVGGRILVEGTPQEISHDERVREVYLGKQKHAA